MLTSPSHDDIPMLKYARAVYRTMGVLPLHVAAELMQEGFIVKELEERWDREFANGNS